jgi:hypothetical protein
MSYTELEFRKKFQFMSDSFVDPAVQTDALGKRADASTPVFGNAPLHSYTGFKSWLNSKTPTEATAVAGSVNFLVNRSYVSTASVSTNTPSEANFYPTRAALASTTYPGATSPYYVVYDYLENLRKAYNLLADFDNLKSGAQVTINTYAINAATAKPVKQYYKFDGISGKLQTSSSSAGVMTDIPERDIHTIIDFNKLITDENVRMNTDLFAVQRSMLLQEMMIHCYIALYLYEVSAGSSDSLTCLQKCIEIFEDLNTNLYRDTNSSESGISAIVKSLNERITTFKSTHDNITTVNTALKANKTILQDTVDRVSSQQKNVGVSKWYQYIALTLLIVVGVVQGLIITSDLPDEKKTVYTTGVFGISIVSALILYVIEMRYFAVSPEGFVSPTLSTYSNVANIGANTSMASKTSMFSDIILKLASEFMDNTTYISLVLQSYRAYGVADYSMKKELKYFSDKNEQIGNESNKLRSVGNVVGLTSRSAFSRTLFYIELLAIMATTALFYVLLAPYPDLQTYPLYIGGFLVVVVMFAYILAVTRLVRTDSSKIYWGKPNFRA